MRKFVGWLFKGLSFCLYRSPRSVKFFIGDILGLLWFDVFRVRRQVVLNNLKIAFPEMSLKQRVSLGRASLKNQGRDLVEYTYLPFITEREAESLFEFENEHYLTDAMAKGKGVCMLTMHMGHGDLALAGLALKGHPVVLISKEFKLRWLNEMWFRMRSRVGAEFIPPRNSSYAVLKALKKNKVVIFVMDQFTGPPIGVRTTFFGKETGTGYGLAMMAGRAETPVVPVYTIRKKDGKHLIRFSSEIEFKEEEDSNSTMQAMTQKYNSYIEGVVRRHPEQWMWIHKRWKQFREPKSDQDKDLQPMGGA